MAAPKEYGIGFLGCGSIGRTHAYCHAALPYFYADLPFRTRLVGVCTSCDETARRAKEEFGFEFPAASAADVIENEAVDVVHICTPNNLHRDELLAVMAAGKHVYCEKPLTSNWPEARDVLTALKTYRGVHQVTFQNRFYPATMRAKQLVEDGSVGPVTCFRAAFLHSSNLDRHRPAGWKFQPGGGVLNDIASHVVDLMQHLVGPFDEVMCASRILVRERPMPGCPSRRVPVEVEDHSCMTVRGDDGLVGTIEATKIATGAQDDLRFEIHGLNGAVAWNLMDPNWLEFCDATAPGEPFGGRKGFTRIPCGGHYAAPGGAWPSAKSPVGWLRGHLACLFHFMQCVHEGRKAEPGIEAGASVQRVLEAARTSEREGRFVRVSSV